MPTITLDFSAAHATRIQDALKIGLELDREITQQDYKDFLILQTIQYVHAIEKQETINAIVPIGDIDIT